MPDQTYGSFGTAPVGRFSSDLPMVLHLPLLCPRSQHLPQVSSYSYQTHFALALLLHQNCPNPYITFLWTLVSQPPSSALTSSSIQVRPHRSPPTHHFPTDTQHPQHLRQNKTLIEAFFTPDVPGTYMLQLDAVAPCKNGTGVYVLDAECSSAPVAVPQLAPAPSNLCLPRLTGNASSSVRCFTPKGPNPGPCATE